MAVLINLTTKYGETREMYVRINNVEASNHGVETHVLFRSYISRDAFKAGANYVDDHPLSFMADVTKPLWEQAFDKLKELYPDAVDVLED